MYGDNDLGLWPSSYPYILRRALNEYEINTSVISYCTTQKSIVPIIVNKIDLWSFPDKQNLLVVYSVSTSNALLILELPKWVAHRRQ